MGDGAGAGGGQADPRTGRADCARPASGGSRRMRVDITVVETNIHYPTDSTLLGDGMRVLTRTMQRITKIDGPIGAKLRDRSRSVKFRLLEIARAAPRQSAQPGQDGTGLPQAARHHG